MGTDTTTVTDVAAQPGEISIDEDDLAGMPVDDYSPFSVRDVIRPLVENTIDYAAVIADMRSKGIRGYYILDEYNGLFVFRGQEIRDVRESSLASKSAMERELDAAGGSKLVRELSDTDPHKIEILRRIDDAAADASNDTVLKNCVLYPEGFASRVDEGTVPSGIYTRLLDCIMEVSGFLIGKPLEL